MSYSPKHNYRAKDLLERGDPKKIVKGKELSDDFEAVARELTAQAGIINDIITGGGVGGYGIRKWDELEEKPEGISNLGYDSQINGGSYNTALKEKV